MSSTPQAHRRSTHNHLEICVSKFGNRPNNDLLLNYFSQFGEIIHHNYASPTGPSGFLFITYRDRSMVDVCMSNRPHLVDNRELFVKRILPHDGEHPDERFEATDQLIIVLDFDDQIGDDQKFLNELRDYFSTYGQIIACKYCHEINFEYILVQFNDRDQVDCVILDKPHFYYEHVLQIMKNLPSNIELTNEKYSNTKRISSQNRLFDDAIDDDDMQFLRRQSSVPKSNREVISEVDLRDEVFRLQELIEYTNREYQEKRKVAEQDADKEMKTLNESIEKTRQTCEELEQDYQKLLFEFQSIQRENEALNEQYLMAELENFELTSHYEQILAEEKAKTVHLQTMAAKLSTRSSPSSKS